MHPAYFALVMATGIVAIGAHLLGLAELAWTLSRINWVAYPVLWILLIARLVLFPKRVWADCSSHQRAPGFFTLVAASGVVGVQAALLHGNTQLAVIMWWITIVLWGLTTYGIFSLLITLTEKPSLEAGINGGWLVSIVATQSVVVLGCVAGANMLGDVERTLFMLLCFWLCGGVLYLWIISLIVYRYFFFAFSPSDLMPPYWINMGAAAISTLGGALLILVSGDSPLLSPMLPFIKGISVTYWANATWWIPMLLALGAWRHVVKGFPMVYDPLYWGLVFPLGMYAVCTLRLGAAVDAPFLITISRIFIIAAAVAWVFAFLGMTRRNIFSLVLVFQQVRNAQSHARPVAGATTQEELEPDEYCPTPNRA